MFSLRMPTIRLSPQCSHVGTNKMSAQTTGRSLNNRSMNTRQTHLPVLLPTSLQQHCLKLIRALFRVLCVVSLSSRTKNVHVLGKTNILQNTKKEYGADPIPHLRRFDRVGHHLPHSSISNQDSWHKHRHWNGPHIRHGHLFHLPARCQ